MAKKNPFEMYQNKKEERVNVKEIQKSEIFNALRSSCNPMMVKKLGKDIKKQIEDVIIPLLSEKQEILINNITNFLNSTSVLPQQKPWMKLTLTEEEFPYKQYTYDELRWYDKSFGGIFKGFGEIECDSNVCDDEEKITIQKNPYYPQSKEEAEARSQYNTWVEDFRDILYDIKTANVLLASLEDNTEYYLNVDQLVALNFDEK